jgi:[glutamine synthetase] adenylyltransferase / [glutamine synthetase]-adenylyl-L-tyrosine phosphorylase
MNSFESQILQLPESAQAPVRMSLQQWQEKLMTANMSFENQQVSANLVKVWYSSQFIEISCSRTPSLLPDLVNSGDLTSVYHVETYQQKLNQFSPSSEAELMTLLRQFRRREMVRIAWRDLAGWEDLTQTLADLSWLADSCIQYALDFLYQQACEKRGTPVTAEGTPINIVVLGMGKLGAFELNYSSDIDLIFAYLHNGQLQDRKQTTYGEFFAQICRSLVKVLDTITVDGFVFRTDIRLRPFGDSGAVIMTFDGMENYYQTQAREWERYAMIKARQVAGDFKHGAQFMAMLKPFIYRKYLDYGAFEELRSLKAQINQENRRKDRLDNVKLGRGGIREIEFIGQAFQLIRGGREPRLQQRGILDILSALGEMELLTREDAMQLIESYYFLRRVENHIQQYQDKQTHDLPKSVEVQKILAYSLDFADWESFLQKLNQVREQVQAVFDEVFSLTEPEKKSNDSHSLWLAKADETELVQQLSGYGFAQPAVSLKVLLDFKSSNAIKRLTSKGAAVMEKLMPSVIEAMGSVNNSDETFKRILDLFEAVAGRNVYLALLAENPDALVQLVKLSAASAWVCDYLARYPVLFDELMDTRSLYEPLKKQALAEQLQQFLAKIETDDEEQVMIALRQFKQLHVLKVAAADIMGAIPLMVVSDYLTYIAETIVEFVVDYAWKLLTEKHGFPDNAMTGSPLRTASHNKAQGFAVLGFGKLGGIELGYGSDLDMVFLYDTFDGNAMTDGEKPLSCTQFYGRLGQKIRHILDTKMLSGVLYEVDLRLRPSGNSGLLVTHIKAYEGYLRNEAWTWEHQALVRARFIAGDKTLQTEYEAIRKRILSLPRDVEKLKTEVREMREKMREALATKEAGSFDLKQSKGGIADIEFIVQFAILNQSAAYPDLTTYTDNVRLIEGLAAHGFFNTEQAQQLKAAYCRYRDFGHAQVLQGNKVVADELEFAQQRAFVEKLWDEIML